MSANAYTLAGLIERIELCGPEGVVVTSRGALTRGDYDQLVRYLAGKEAEYRWVGGRWEARCPMEACERLCDTRTCKCPPCACEGCARRTRRAKLGIRA